MHICKRRRILPLIACTIFSVVTFHSARADDPAFGIRSGGVDDRLECTLYVSGGLKGIDIVKQQGGPPVDIEFGDYLKPGNNTLACQVFNMGGPFAYEFEVWTGKPLDRTTYERFIGSCPPAHPPIPECDTSYPVLDVRININKPGSG